MRSPETYFALGLAFLLVLFVGLGSAPVAAETFPTDTTKLQWVKLRYDYDVRASWQRTESVRSADIVGWEINKIEVGITVAWGYVPIIPMMINTNTRVHATITSPDDGVVFVGFLAELGQVPGGVDGAWELSRLQHFTAHTLTAGTYTITVTYEILIGDTWTHVDTAIHYLTCYGPEPLDVTTDVLVWLPIMMSFAVIVGMGFIGFNMVRRHDDPMPALFMVFTGVVLTWSIGWLPTWVLVMTLALVAILSASLWGKVFRGR